MESGNHPHSNITNLNPSGSSNGPSDVQVLRNLLIMSMAGLILVSGSFMLFMYQQMRMVRAQLAEQRPAVQRALQDYNQTSLPLIQRFSSRIRDYAAKHPDFKPILQKYEPVLGDLATSPSPIAPVTAPAPGTAPQK